MAESSRPYKCGECGEEFDSQRGLHIHQSKVHKGVSAEKKKEKVEIPGFPLRSLKPLVFVVIILLLGISFLAYANLKVDGEMDHSLTEDSVKREVITVFILPEEGEPENTTYSTSPTRES